MGAEVIMNAYRRMAVTFLNKIIPAGTSPIRFQGIYRSLSELRERNPGIRYHTEDSIKFDEERMIAAKTALCGTGDDSFYDEFHPRYSPLGIFLSGIAKRAEPLRIVDIGGGAGYGLVYLRRQCRNAFNVSYCIFDLPELVNIGNEIFQGAIRYRADLNNIADERPDVIFFGASIQYIADLEDRLELIGNSTARYMMLADSPLTQADQFCSMQRLGPRLIPSIIHNKSKLITGLGAYGYETLSQFTVRNNEYFIAMPTPCSQTKYYTIIFEKKAY